MSELTNAQRLALVAASGGTVGSTPVAQLSLSVDAVVSSAVPIAEWAVDFDLIAGGAGATIAAEMLLCYDTTGTSNGGFFTLKIGGATHGTIGGTERARVTPTQNNTFNQIRGNTGASFTNPGGQILVQIVPNVADGGSTFGATLHSAHIKVGTP